MNDQERRQCAESLLLARRSGVPIDPVVLTYPQACVEDAYAVQLAQVRSWIAEGQRVIGHKVGLSPPVMQSESGVDQPDHGHLLTDMFQFENHPIPIDHFILPQIQPAIAFVLGRRLVGPGVTVAEAIQAIDFALPALEILDSRIKAWNLTVIDTIADNASSGAVVLGSRPVLLRQADLNRSSVQLYLNGESVASGRGGAVLGSPMNAVVWLANTLGRHEIALEEGNVILPGSATRASFLLPGDIVEAAFDDLGSVRCLAAGSSSGPKCRRNPNAPSKFWSTEM